MGARHMEFEQVPGKLPFPIKSPGFRYWAIILLSATSSLTVWSLFFMADIQVVRTHGGL